MGKSSLCVEEVEEVKKGPWTPEEDEKLLHYIHIHGAGKWRSLPKNAGLKRCGKSCRLRWTNYLRPDVKRGEFSLYEEHTIIHLHRFLGNKWSTIAAQLPGRTDNDIKNYWNTHIKKKLMRMGIDPVTHCPRINLLQLNSILYSTLFKSPLQPNSTSDMFNSACTDTQILNLLSNLVTNPSQDNIPIDSCRYLQPNQPQTKPNHQLAMKNQLTNDHQTDLTGLLSSQITSPIQWHNNVEYYNYYLPYTDSNNRSINNVLLTENLSVCISKDDSENSTRWNIFGSVLPATPPPSSSSMQLDSSLTVAYIKSEDERESYGGTC